MTIVSIQSNKECVNHQCEKFQLDDNKNVLTFRCKVCGYIYKTPRLIFKENNWLFPEYKRKYELKSGKEIITVYNRKQVVKTVYECNEVLALDSETYEGKCRLLANSMNEYIMRKKNEKDIHFFHRCLEFIYRHYKTKGIYRFFYNIDFDFTAILKLWSSKNMFHNLRLDWLRKGLSVKYKNFVIKWIPSRLLSIKHIKRKRSVVFTDLFNFYHSSLDNISRTYFNKNKIDDIDGNLLNTSLNYWKKRKKDIIKYCIYDCKLTQNAGKYLIKSIQESELELPRWLISSASLSKQYFRKNVHIPRIHHIPEKIMQIAYKCYFGGRFEIFEKGYFERLYLYDINSQYPDFIKQLPNLASGVWQKDLKIPLKQTFGFYLVKVNIPYDCHIPTIPIKQHPKGIVKFPVGKMKKWMTWFDIDLMRKYVVKVYDGYRFIHAHSEFDVRRYPFFNAISTLYAKKSRYKGVNELNYMSTKLCMNADYGCYIEKQERYDYDLSKSIVGGIMFNCVYGTMITAYGRWSVIKDIPKSKHEHVKAIHTDSIISDIPLEKYLKIGKKIGEWNKESEGKGIIINTGMYQIGYVVKTRGITKKHIKNWIRFCFKYQIYKKKEFEILHMRKLSEGLVRDKSLINVNTMQVEKKSVNPNSDTKRCWIDDFKSFREVKEKRIMSYATVCEYNFKELDVNPYCYAYF